MRPAALAWRGMVRQPARAALGVLGVAAVGALLFDMLLLSRGLVISFRDLLDSMGFDVRVTATGSLPGFGPPIEGASEIAESLRELPEVEDVVPFCFGRARTARPDTVVWFYGSGPRARRAWTVIEGSNLPERKGAGPPPIIVNRRLAADLALRPGDPLRLRAETSDASALPSVEFRVTGIADFPYDASDARTAATTLEAYFRTYGEADRNTADMLLVASRAGHETDSAVSAILRANPELHAFSNAFLVTRFRNTEFSYFRQVSFVLSSITLFFAFLLVATLLTVSVNQRLAEVAALRALGFSRRRVVTDLLWESALLVGAGGLLALPLGAALARQLDSILRTMPNIPERFHFFVFEPRAAVLHLALLAATGLLASLYPVYLAVRLPIAATLRKETVS